MVPGQLDCFVQCEVVSSQISLADVQPRDSRTPWWYLSVIWWGDIRIILASASSSIRAIWKDAVTDYRCKVRLLSYPPHLIIANKLVPFDSKQFLRHHWSRASVPHASTLVTDQHSHPYRKTGRIQALHNVSFVGIEMRDFQKWLSRLCIAARVIPLRCMMSGECFVLTSG